MNTKAEHSILVTTLGTTWEIVPELLGFTNINEFTLFAKHPKKNYLIKTIDKNNIKPVQEVWVITTDAAAIKKSLKNLKEWIYLINNRVKLRIFKLSGIAEVVNINQSREMADLIYRVVLNAKDYAVNGQLLLSLAGGRKVMSAEMQQAGNIFGCHALLHVINNNIIPDKYKNPISFSKSLPAAISKQILPIILGTAIKEKYFLYTRYKKFLKKYNISVNKEICNLIPSSNFYTEIHKQLQNADNLVYNFYFDLLKGKNISNFQILYLFPPDFITKLKAYKIGKNKKMREQELLFLTKLPKAELHCHLGGIATPAEIVETALENKLSILNLKNNNSKYSIFLSDVRQAVRNNSISELIELVPDIKGLRNKFNIPEPYSVAGFLLQFKNNIDLLSKFIYRDYLNNSTFKGIGIDNYEKLGDLQGSGLLQNELSIRKACKLIINKALKHNVHYLELRCSPVNYTRADLTEEDVVNIIVDEISKHPLNVKLIFIASRHGKMSTIYRHIELATKLLKTHKIFKKLFVGFDLAGNENSKEPNELSYAFLPLMEQCVKLTIHAGETEKVNNIWQAVYRLNADRIGHGLKLVNNKELLAKFRDRKIAVEMCPSSNNQIVGFHNFNNKNDKTTKIYPLKNYINEGLRVTINTDNPGISLTDFSQELFVASMLTEGGLSIWDILQLIKNSFRSAFTSVDERHDLIVNAEKEISKILQKEFKSGILST